MVTVNHTAATHKVKLPHWSDWDYGLFAAGQFYTLFRIAGGEKCVHCFHLPLTDDHIVRPYNTLEDELERQTTVDKFVW